MANIKFKKLLEDAFPMQRVNVINEYYSITAKKNSVKYFEKWDRLYESKWEIVEDLKLYERLSSRKRILDIGAGPHIFAWLAVRLGHYVSSTELPLKNPYVTKQNLEYFHDIKKALLLDKIIKTYDFTIDKSTSQLPEELRDRWDIITIQRSNFDIGWQTKEYRNFITMCYNHLNPVGGCIYYEVAREQYSQLVDHVRTNDYLFDCSIGRHQGKVIVYHR